MRRKFILILASTFTDRPSYPPRPSNRPMFSTSHRGPGVCHGIADPEDARQLILSITQTTLLQAGHIMWAGLNLTPFIATISREADHEPAK